MHPDVQAHSHHAAVGHKLDAILGVEGPDDAAVRSLDRKEDDLPRKPRAVAVAEQHRTSQNQGVGGIPLSSAPVLGTCTYPESLGKGRGDPHVLIHRGVSRVG